MKAVVYGAGNIGRGFIGQIFSLSGYEVVFIDVDEAVVSALNEDNRYPVCVISGDSMSESYVENVRAIDGRNVDAVISEIASADIMATAVGVNVLGYIAPTLARSISVRFSDGNSKPLNIIICENKIDADTFLHDLAVSHLNEDEKVLLDSRVGFVMASVGRMVPVQTNEMKANNILNICTESYNKLYADKDSFKGGIPDLVNFEPFSPFSFCIERKLFIHNMGHACAAYLGYLKGYTHIHEAMNDASVYDIVKRATLCSAAALAKKYTVPIGGLIEHTDDLLLRFRNAGLNDTVARVGGDPFRKLSTYDRIAGAIRLCAENDVLCDELYMCMAAGLLFTANGDKSEADVSDIIAEHGLSGFLKSHAGLYDSATIDAVSRWTEKLRLY